MNIPTKIIILIIKFERQGKRGGGEERFLKKIFCRPFLLPYIQFVSI